MEDIIGAALSAIYRIVTAVIRFPIILVLVAAGVGMSMIGGTAGWLGFIGASLLTTAIFKRYLRRDVKAAMVGWVGLHLVPVAWCVVHFASQAREPLGIGLGVGWFAGLVLVGWKVPSRRQPAQASPPAVERSAQGAPRP